MTDAHPSKLKRSLGFWTLVVYGVGDILGAGIYALVGKIAGIAGHLSWLAFLVALAAAALTALSYAELGSRFPRSGGESYFCHQAFRSPDLALLIGWLVFCSGLLSMATVSRAFSGYLLGLFSQPPEAAQYAVMAGFLVILAGINFWGIRQSSLANITCTFVEVSGLILVIVVGISFLGSGAKNEIPTPDSGPVPEAAWLAVAQGAALAFFAFIGFEDMVNVAEEVQSPSRNMPAAILTALGIAGTVYIAVVYIATAVVPPTQLSQSSAPLLDVVQRAAPGVPISLFTLIALFAVANTALLNFIMGSRLLYGMAEQQLLPEWLGRVHPLTHTPHWSILFILVVAIALAYSGTLVYLAGTTSVLLLLVFVAVNGSLVIVKQRQERSSEYFRTPLLVPVLGGLSSLILLLFLPPASLGTALAIIAVGLVLVVVHKKRRSSEP